jgi:LPS-assembly lipoprotein
MWLARAALLVVFAASLAGCGFEPLYGERARTFDQTLASVYVESIPERDGQLLAISLRDSFNPYGQPVETKYRLRVALTTSRREVAVRLDATASRLQLDTVATWTLLPVTVGGKQASGTARAITSFDITDNEYANLVAEKDGRARLIREIGEEIRIGVRRVLTKPDAA